MCGGRDFADFNALSNVLDEIHAKTPIDLLIHGGARGADTMAGMWAAKHDVPCLRHPAEWGKDKRAAGVIRNIKMLRYKPQTCVAFPGGVSTADMVARSRAAGMVVTEVA